MLKSLLIGVVGIVLIMILWVIVQSLWRKSFSDYIRDEDVLADRITCGNCGCSTPCTEKQ